MGTEEKVEEIRSALAQFGEEMSALDQEYEEVRQELGAVLAKIDQICSDGQPESYAEALSVLENFMRKLNIDFS